MLSDFYKKNENDAVWWVQDLSAKGRLLFSFDRKKIFNLFRDYPNNLTPEQKRVFDQENPYWRDFFNT